jgi:hypothetical protein
MIGTERWHVAVHVHGVEAGSMEEVSIAHLLGSKCWPERPKINPARLPFPTCSARGDQYSEAKRQLLQHVVESFRVR